MLSLKDLRLYFCPAIINSIFMIDDFEQYRPVSKARIEFCLDYFKTLEAKMNCFGDVKKIVAFFERMKRSEEIPADDIDKADGAVHELKMHWDRWVMA